jgi:hypothetical protein
MVDRAIELRPARRLRLRRAVLRMRRALIRGLVAIRERGDKHRTDAEEDSAPADFLQFHNPHSFN